jgi:hypothetical protein
LSQVFQNHSKKKKGELCNYLTPLAIELFQFIVECLVDIYDHDGDGTCALEKVMRTTLDHKTRHNSDMGLCVYLHFGIDLKLEHSKQELVNIFHDRQKLAHYFIQKNMIVDADKYLFFLCSHPSPDITPIYFICENMNVHYM